jgi:uncharacterized coiled-coil DUF342 family protein
MTMLTGLSSSAPDSAPSARDAPQPSPHAAQQASDQAVENAALAGASAIRQVIDERNELRRERERLSAVNNELRDQIGKITTARDQYVRIASDLYAELKQLHSTIRATFEKARGLPENRDANLIDLARRFSPEGNRLQGKRD